MKRVRKPSVRAAAVGAEVMAAVVAAVAVAGIAAGVAAVAGAAEIAATVETAATAGNFPFVIEMFFDFGCAGFAPEVFLF